MALDWILFISLVLYTTVECIVFVVRDEPMLPDFVVFCGCLGVLGFGLPTALVPAYTAIYEQLPPGTDIAKFVVSFGAVSIAVIAYYVGVVLISVVMQDVLRTRNAKWRQHG